MGETTARNKQVGAFTLKVVMVAAAIGLGVSVIKKGNYASNIVGGAFAGLIIGAIGGNIILSRKEAALAKAESDKQTKTV